MLLAGGLTATAWSVPLSLYFFISLVNKLCSASELGSIMFWMKPYDDFLLMSWLLGKAGRGMSGRSDFSFWPIFG